MFEEYFFMISLSMFIQLQDENLVQLLLKPCVEEAPIIYLTCECFEGYFSHQLGKYLLKHNLIEVVGKPDFSEALTGDIKEHYLDGFKFI